MRRKYNAGGNFDVIENIESDVLTTYELRVQVHVQVVLKFNKAPGLSIFQEATQQKQSFLPQK